MAGDELAVEVAYAAAPDRQVVRAVLVPRGSSVEAAIRQSGLLAEFPEIDLAGNRAGVYGEPVALDMPLKGGERVEIYRPLQADPKEARRRRARATQRRRR